MRPKVRESIAFCQHFAFLFLSIKIFEVLKIPFDVEAPFE